MVRGEMQKPLFKRSMRLHRGVERVFADAKGRRGLARLHLRGLRGAGGLIPGARDGASRSSLEATGPESIREAAL